MKVKRSVEDPLKEWARILTKAKRMLKERLENFGECLKRAQERWKLNKICGKEWQWRRNHDEV